MSEMTIDFRLHAEVNGGTFDMDGHGVGDATTGGCELHLTGSPAFREGFDPVSCPMICSHPTSTYFSRPTCEGESFADVSGHSYSVERARQGNVYDSAGTCLLDLRVTSTVRVVDGRLQSYHEMRGFSHLPRLDRNLIVGDDYIVSAGAGRALAIVPFGLLTIEGDELRGICTVPYELADADARCPVLARTVETLEVDWNGGRDVSAYYRTSIRALTDISSVLPVGAGV